MNQGLEPLIINWINALLIDAGCLYELRTGKLIRANGKFGRKFGEWLKK